MKKNDNKKKHKLKPNISGKYGAYMYNALVRPDGKTETGAPIPSEESVEYAREYGEELEL